MLISNTQYKYTFIVFFYSMVTLQVSMYFSDNIVPSVGWLPLISISVVNSPLL